MNIRIDLNDKDLESIMPLPQWLIILEEILALLPRLHQPPPSAIRNLTAVVRKNSTMSTATLKWTDPTTDNTGAPLPSGDLVSINIFDDASTTPTTPIGNVPATNGANTFTTGTLTPGTHNFTAVAVDVNGNASLPSNVATGNVTTTEPAPAAITDLSVTINP
jgi:hypothetical protein